MKITNAILTIVLFVFATNSYSYVSHQTFISKDWKAGLYGHKIGESGISIFDIDNDNTDEIILGGTLNNQHVNDFWYIVKNKGQDTYEQVWISEVYETGIAQLLVQDLQGDQTGEILVGLANGTLEIFDGVTLELVNSIEISNNLKAFSVADLDGVGSLEIIATDGTDVFIYSSFPFILQSTIYGKGGDVLAAGNVDSDPAIEIVTSSPTDGFIIDSKDLVPQWNFSRTFGTIIELGDIDDDGMDELIGKTGSYSITIFDVDIKTPAAEIRTESSIGSLLVEDTDNDQIPEILYSASQFGQLHCIDGATLLERWSIDNIASGPGDIALGDVDNDDVIEVIWGIGSSSGTKNLCIADTRTHTLEWNSFYKVGSLTAVDVGDVDDDGEEEIIMVSNAPYHSQRLVISVFNASDHMLEYEQLLNSDRSYKDIHSVKIGDVDDDGESEFVVTTSDSYEGKIQIYNGTTKQLERESPYYDDIFITNLEIHDVDSDGKTELIAIQGGETTAARWLYLIVYDGKDFTEKWRSVSLSNYENNLYDLEVANLDDDPNLEIVVTIENGETYIYDGLTHQLDALLPTSAYAIAVDKAENGSSQQLYVGENGSIAIFDTTDFSFLRRQNFPGSEVIGLKIEDLDGNNRDEIIVTDNSYIWIFDKLTFQLHWKSDLLSNSRYGERNHINILDVDNDLRKDIILGSNSSLYHFETQLIPIVSADPLETLLGPTEPTVPSEPQELTVSNIGGAPLQIGTVTKVCETDQQEKFSILANTCSGKQLSPGAYCTFEVAFTPTTYQSHQVCSISVSSNDNDVPVLHLNLRGLVAQPTISVAPEGINFGETELNQESSPQSISIRSTGNAELHISEITLDGASATDFSVLDDGCSDQTLSPDETCNLSLLFTPTSGGKRTAELAISSNDPFNDISTISLSGTGGISSIKGKVTLTGIAGHSNLEVKNATITLLGTKFSTTTDDNGYFYLLDIPDGNYTVSISAPHLTTVTRDISLVDGLPIELTDLPPLSTGPSISCDINNDSKLGLEEAIFSLQVLVN